MLFVPDQLLLVDACCLSTLNNYDVRAIGAEQLEAHRLYNDAPPSVGTSYALGCEKTRPNLCLFILIAF